MLKGSSAASRSGSGAGARSRASFSNASTSALPGNSKEDNQPSIGSPPHEISGTGSEETDLSTSEEEDSSWISWFCGVRGNQFLCEIEEDYIQDDFNLCGLQAEVPNYDYALDMILDNESLSDEIGEEHVEIESDAELLYGLIHARFILTVKGLHAMVKAKGSTSSFNKRSVDKIFIQKVLSSSAQNRFNGQKTLRSSYLNVPGTPSYWIGGRIRTFHYKVVKAG